MKGKFQKRPVAVWVDGSLFGNLQQDLVSPGYPDPDPDTDPGWLRPLASWLSGSRVQLNLNFNIHPILTFQVLFKTAQAEALALVILAILYSLSFN